MEAVCGQVPLWNSTISATDPPWRLPTRCFHKTFAIWIPLALLVLVGIPRSILERSRKRNKAYDAVAARSANNRIFFLIKVFLYVTVSLIAVAELALNSAENFDNVETSEHLYVASILLSVLSCAIIIWLRGGQRAFPSTIIFISWLLTAALHIPAFLVIMENSGYNTSTSDACQMLLMIVFILLTLSECIGGIRSNNEDGSSLISILTFGWMTPLMRIGFRRELCDEDMPKISESVRLPQIKKRFSQHYNMDQGGTGGQKVSFLRCLLKTFGKDILMVSFFRISTDLIYFAGPQILRHFIRVLETGDYAWKGYSYAILLTGCSLCGVLTFHVCHRKAKTIGHQMRACVSAAVYEKSLRVSSRSSAKFTAGEVTNLMTSDAIMFHEMMAFIDVLYSGPLQLCLAAYFLNDLVGWEAALAGLSMIFICVPVNLISGKIIRTLQIKLVDYKDQRLKLVNEVFQGIKAIKFSAWEEVFAGKINAIREKEIKCFKESAKVRSAMNVVFTVCPALVTFTTFATYVALDPVNNILTAEKAFACIAIVAILRGPMFMFPHAVVGAIRLSVSVKRINEYLNCEDTQKDQDVETSCHNEDNEIEIEKATLNWTDKDTLKNINLDVKKGSLVAVIGTVGSGKSSLLSTILGEMNLSSGKLRVASKQVSYVPQHAWVQNLTVRDNILFGNEMEEKKYWNIVEACAMTEDVEIFPARDLTEIGDHGINLSGGQKQRVSLARAAYADAQLVLLDDPLSAVDAHVAEHIFTNLIGPKGFMASKTRVLATHNLTYLSKVDKIVLLKDGCISAIGSYSELSSTSSEFKEYVRTASLQTANTAETDIYFTQKQKREKQVTQEKDGRITEEEKSSDARVDVRHFLYYFKNMGYVSVVGIAVFLITSQTLNTLMTYVLGLWTEEEKGSNQEDNSHYLILLASLILSLIIFDYLKEYLLNYRCAVASEHIHKDSLDGVLMSPMSFFDANPVGRILNRFSQDLFTLDMHFPGQLSGCAAIIPMWIWSVITVGLFFPSLVLGILALVAIAALMQVGFARTKRQLKRMEAITRSPLYAHFTESVSGSAIVRAFNSKERFIKENCQHLSKNLNRGYVLFISDKWLGVRIEIMNNLVILMTSLAMVYYRESIVPGIAAFILTNVFTSTEFIGLGVYLFSETETDSISLERLREYAELDRESNCASVNPEKDRVEMDHFNDDNWPKTGHISMSDYSTKYLNSHDDVLKRINLQMKDGERLGICGRTGAGKSSLTLAMLRIIEATSGKIELDGRNIALADLKRLRTSVTIIPQDPVLFSGSLRSNVDPTDKLSDSEVWKALEISKLTDWVKSLQGGIEHEVEAGGNNFSAGQRQQICLARALARREETRVLILDEATSAVDHVTDANIQKAIAEGFPGCTILTVAHRLNTIKDSSDRVLVLSHGQVVENSCPKELMADETSAFYKMCKDAGVL